MCGIAGWIDYENDISNQDCIINMSNALKNRGPDEEGHYMSNNVCLLHRRLIVIDPENGKQPMFIEAYGNKYTIIYNGEIYNTEEIKKELLALGYSFKGHSDTEVILTSFVHWGYDCAKKLNGIFSFAVWDHLNEKLFLVRDRMGVKPLFFYEYKKGLIFASEIKALLCNPIVKPAIDEDGLKEIFFIGPGRTPGNGIIKGVKELKPGHFAVFSKEGLNINKYWELKAFELTDSLNVAIEKTRFLVTRAIESQLVSDVPLCCFLSGGLDSSIISKVTSDYFKKYKKDQLCTYSIDYHDNFKYFKENKYQPNSDSEFINLMVSFIKSNHKTVNLSNEPLAHALYDATLARDLPGMADIDSSLLLFCKEIKKDFTVALSGECADEIFGGYPWYHDKDILFKDSFPWSSSLNLRQNLLKKGLFKNTEDYVKQRYSDTIKSVPKLKNDSKLNSRMREMFYLNLNWFMQTLLDRKDRMSMYSGLEVRVPFCDYRIVEYAFNMPWEIKSYNAREKGILREAMKGILTDEIIFRKKSPYPKTYNPVYMKIVCSKVKEILKDKTSPLFDLLDHNFVLYLMENENKIKENWYGQLMKVPQIMAYIIQIDYWFKKYNINII